MALPTRPPGYKPPVSKPDVNPATNPNAAGPVRLTQHDPNTAGLAQADSATSITAMQRFLKNRGYDIAVDGVRGPETNAAVLAFHKKVAPQSFNASRTSTKTKSVAAPVKTGAAGGNSSSSKGSSKSTASAGRATTVAAVDPATGQLIDPAAYASGSVNAQYNPQINEILRQITQGRSDQTSHAKQIQDWFNQALAAQATDATDNATAGRQAQDAYNSANTNVLNLFGGPNATDSTASEAAAFHDIGLGNLSADVNAQAQFDKNLRSIEALKGSEAQTAQYNTDQSGLKDLAAKLLDLKGAKGQAYTAAYQQGVQNRTQQEAANQQLALAKQLAPAQVAQAQAAADAARANATTATVNAKSAAANAATQLAIARTRLKQANIQTQQALATNGGKWNLTLPAQQGALQKALETNVYGPRGALAISPEAAWANLQQQLQMNGLGNDPHAQQIAQGVFLQGLWTSHSLGNFGGFAWNGKKIVRTGNKYTFDKKTGTRSLVNSKGKVIPDYKPYRK